MNISDFFARAIINITNPIDYLAIKSIYSTRKFFEHLRYRAASTAKKAKTVVRFNEIKKNLSKIITSDKIKKLYDETFKEESSIKNMLDSNFKQNEDLNSIIYPEAKKRLESAEEEYLNNQLIILDAEQQLRDYEKKLEEQKYTYFPTTTEFDTGESVSVNAENIAKYKKIIKEYESDANGQPLTRQQINAKYKRDLKSADPEIRKAAKTMIKLIRLLQIMSIIICIMIL